MIFHKPLSELNKPGVTEYIMNISRQIMLWLNSQPRNQVLTKMTMIFPPNEYTLTFFFYKTMWKRFPFSHFVTLPWRLTAKITRGKEPV